jgi:hypothetical protein
MFMRLTSIGLSILCMPSLMIASSAAAAAQAATSAAADQKTITAEAAVTVPADVCKAIEAGDSDAVIAWLQKNPEAHKNARGPENRPLLTMLIMTKVGDLIRDKAHGRVQGKESLQAAIDAVLNHNPDVWLRDNEGHSALCEAAYEREDGQIARNLVQRMYAQAKKTDMCKGDELGTIKSHMMMLTSKNDTSRKGRYEANEELTKIAGQEVAEFEKIKERLTKHLSDASLAIMQQYLVAEGGSVERGLTVPVDIFNALDEDPKQVIAWIEQDREKHKNARCRYNTTFFRYVFSLWGNTTESVEPVIDFLLECKPYISLDRHASSIFGSSSVGVFYDLCLNRKFDEARLRKIIGILRDQGHWWIRIREEMNQDFDLGRNFSQVDPDQAMQTIEKEIKEARAMTPLIAHLPRELLYIVQDYVSLVGDGSGKIARNDMLAGRMQQLQIEEIDVAKKQSEPSEAGC